MARLRRSNGASKHALPEILDDPTLEAKSVILKKPVDWEEDGDSKLQSTSAPDLDDPPNCFLKLPTELRIEIYRYCLTQDKPIQVIPWPYIPKEFAVGLLGTCELMHDECAQILYGENEFIFPGRLDHVRLLGFLRQIGPDNRSWLRHLTVQVPFQCERFELIKHPDHLSVRTGTVYSDMKVYYKHICPELSLATGDDVYDWQQITWGYLARSLVCTLQSLPRLRNLTFVLSDGWVYRDEQRIWCEEWPPEWTSPDNAVIWTSLEAWLRARHCLRLSVVQTLDDRGSMISPNLEIIQDSQRRFLANLKRRLGVWDHRVLHYDGEFQWKMPDQMMEDPDEYLRDLQCLFAERTI